METFEILAKKNRRRNTKKILILSIAVVLSFISIYIATRTVLEKMTEHHMTEVTNFYENRLQIAYPNIYSNSNIHNTTGFSNLYQLSRFKDVDGVTVPYDTVTASVGPNLEKIDHVADSVIPTSGVNKNIMAFNAGQRVKIPLFFNIKNKDETDIMPTPSQELPLVSEMKGQLVEVALTFDRPYTYSELQSMLPSNLKVNWYWLGTYSNYNTENLNISNIFGFKLTKDDAEYSFDIFKTHLKNSLKDKHGLTSITTSKGEVYNTKKELEYLNKTFKNLEDCTFSGVILTGKAENFAQLEEKEWIYASSIGASVPNQPYYKLDKE